jgi:formylglycine-generating enzyme required for sulfatase activity
MPGKRPDLKPRPARRVWTREKAFSFCVSILGIPVCLAVLFFVATACERGAQQAPAAQPASAAQKTITTAGGLTMVLIPSGEFEMGDNNGDPDERPAHKVQVSAFYMDTHEVSQRTYETLVQQNPSKSKGPDKPVEQVDWYHAILFCNMRSLKEVLKPCYDSKTLICDFSADGYRLPTEAEWEYACRAGMREKYSFGNDPTKLKNCAWFKSNAGQVTHSVGQKAPNPWGLYDMHGNVAEWCHDFYSETYYSSNPAKDPHGPTRGDKCVLRGGSWRSSEEGCRSSARSSETPRFADACFGSDACGFRCVRTAK